MNTDSAFDPVVYLTTHPHWDKLGPKRREVALLLALNEYDVTTNALSSLTTVELHRKYRYSPDQFSNTFRELRRLGIARPRQQFVDHVPDDPEDRRRGRHQTATRYTLESNLNGWKCIPRKRRKPRVRKLGKIPFTRWEIEQAQKQMRNRAA